MEVKIMTYLMGDFGLNPYNSFKYQALEAMSCVGISAASSIGSMLLNGLISSGSQAISGNSTAASAQPSYSEQSAEFGTKIETKEAELREWVAKLPQGTSLDNLENVEPEQKYDTDITNAETQMNALSNVGKYCENLTAKINGQLTKAVTSATQEYYGVLNNPTATETDKKTAKKKIDDAKAAKAIAEQELEQAQQDYKKYQEFVQAWETAKKAKTDRQDEIKDIINNHIKPIQKDIQDLKKQKDNVDLIVNKQTAAAHQAAFNNGDGTIGERCDWDKNFGFDENGNVTKQESNKTLGKRDLLALINKYRTLGNTEVDKKRKAGIAKYLKDNVNPYDMKFVSNDTKTAYEIILQEQSLVA